MPDHAMSTQTPTELRRYRDRSKWLLSAIGVAIATLGGVATWGIGTVREAANIEHQVKSNTEHKKEPGHGPALRDIAVIKADVGRIKTDVREGFKEMRAEQKDLAATIRADIRRMGRR